MPRLSVFSCPSCGASLSVEEGSAKTQCSFCGNTVIVPEELRGTPAASATPNPTPYGAPMSMPSLGTVSGMPDMGKLKQMGDAIRAGNKIEAIKIYRELFGVGLAEAKTAVEQMAAGQAVTVNQINLRARSAAEMNASALGSQFGSPYVTPSAPMIVTNNPARTGGCAVGIVGLIIALTTVGVALAVAFAAFPDLGAVISSTFSQVTNSYPREVMSFGGEGTGTGLFQDPRAVAVAPDGTIYVAEFTGGKVKVFDAAGKYVTEWNGGVTKDSIIQGMAVDRQGTVYLAVDGDIHRFDGASGDDLGVVDFADGWGFDDVAVTPSGGLAATWYKGDDDIVVFDKNGKVINTIKNAASGVTGDSELDMHLAVDGNGDIFVLGTFNNAVFHYSPTGNYVNKFGRDGDEPGQFRAPGDIAVDNQSRVYVSDFKGVQVFASDGRYLSVFKPTASFFAYAMTFDDQGALYLVGNDKKVHKMLMAAPEQ